jgi:hypothetical protein
MNLRDKMNLRDEINLRVTTPEHVPMTSNHPNDVIAGLVPAIPIQSAVPSRSAWPEQARP